MIAKKKSYLLYMPGWIVLFVFLSVVFQACGKKADPIPPKYEPVCAPVELKEKVQGDTVILSWRHSGRPGASKYTIYRAALDAAKPACPGCPLIFQDMGSLSVDSATETVEFKDQMSSGFIYTYKVVPVGLTGDKGPASNLVVIDLSLQ